MIRKNFGREYPNSRSRWGNAVEFRMDQSYPLPTLTRRLELNDTMRYLNIVIKPLCGDLDICLNYYFRSRNSVRVSSVADRDRKWNMLFGSRFSVTLLHNLADFTTVFHFGHEKPEHMNVPNETVYGSITGGWLRIDICTLLLLPFKWGVTPELDDSALELITAVAYRCSSDFVSSWEFWEGSVDTSGVLGSMEYCSLPSKQKSYLKG